MKHIQKFDFLENTKKSFSASKSKKVFSFIILKQIIFIFDKKICM